MYYFAYASNLSKKQMAERCPEAKPKYPAFLPNHKLIFTGWSRKWRGGTASLRRVQGERVAGAVYEVSARDLQQLDKFEGYNEGLSERRNVIVFTEDDEAVEAVTYVKKEQAQEGKPSPEYVALVQQGYRDWRIE
jgi:gamma-glutamylcyclotransferase